LMVGGALLPDPAFLKKLSEEPALILSLGI
jgi:hypothetical protein